MVEKTLKEKAAELSAKQQSKDAKNKMVDGLTIAGIRALPGMTPEIEAWMTQFQSSIPSLAKTPTAPSASGVSFQPPGVLPQHRSAPNQTPNPHDDEEFDLDFVYSTSRGKLVRVVHDSPGRRRSVPFPPPSYAPSPVRNSSQSMRTPVTNQDNLEDEDTLASDDEDCPVEPAKGYKLVWYRDENGRKYFVQKEQNLPELVKSYVCDEATGRWYEQMVPREKRSQPRVKMTNVSDTQQSVPTRTFLDHRTNSKSPVPQMSRGIRTPASSSSLPKGERVRGFFHGDSEKRRFGNA